MKTFKIHLIRHGATDANAAGMYIGNRTDLPLSPEGVKELGQMRESIEYPDIERLYTSPMLRCRQSANIIYPGFEAHVIDELTEYDFGEFEGKTAEQLEKYEDWNRRLQEFMDMTPEEREKIIQDSKLRISTNQRLNKIMDMFQYFW